MPHREAPRRLHYQWSNLEADRSAVNVGSPSRPLPPVDRTLQLFGSDSRRWPRALCECEVGQARFAACADVYKTIEYNTFYRNGSLKLTEVELFFLSSYMTRTSSCEWLVVYLGIGSGDRFRYLRDEFFPDLTVLGFDPVDAKFEFCREYVEENSRIWNSDGTNYFLHVRCMDLESDVAHVREKYRGKKLLLISDIRGVAKRPNGHFDKSYDQDTQWQAICSLRPVSSLVKFTFPHPKMEFYDYAPGTLLKQIYCNYGTLELRLLIEGVPQTTRRYNGWEMSQKMVFHHEHLRGQVYQDRGVWPDGPACLDSCFDCTVLRDTVWSYAQKNSLDPKVVLQKLLQFHVIPLHSEVWGMSYLDGSWDTLYTFSHRWWDVESSLRKGLLTEAIACLEGEGEADPEGTDWTDITRRVVHGEQPDLAMQIKKSLKQPASRGDLIRVLGSLAEPFTIVKTELNTLLYWDEDDDPTESADKVQCTFYAAGSCRFGINCYFKHGNDIDAARLEKSPSPN